jgi:Na+/proline symporter
MKTVVWTDVFQSLVMISGLLAIVVIQVLYSVHSMAFCVTLLKEWEGVTSCANVTNATNYG